MRLLTTFAIVAFLLSGCGTKKQTSVIAHLTPLPSDAIVEVSGAGQPIPSGAQLLGSVAISDSGFSKTKNCTYDRVLADAQSQARAMGGNHIHITEHKHPNVWSSCHRIKAEVYLVKK